MKYIKITNSTKEVSRLKLEKLGMSTKRENDETIGQFGSGIKFAPISAIRQGIDFAFTGADSNGEYTLKYVIKDEEGIPCVFYDYGTYQKPSSFTAEAGMLSWESPFQVYREVIANANDEAIISGVDWTSEIVDNVTEIKPVENEFSVYLEATDEIMEVHNNFDKYFCLNRDPIAEISRTSKIYDSLDEKLHVYCKGVLVYSHEKEMEKYSEEEKSLFLGHSLFDYEINNLVLNEERTVSQTYQMMREVVTCLSDIQDKKLIAYILSKMILGTTEYYEFTSIPAYMHTYSSIYENTNWTEAFDEAFPRSVIMNSDSYSINAQTTIKSKGLNPLLIKNNSFYEFLKARGIKTLNDVFNLEDTFEVDHDIEKYPRLIRAIKMVTDALIEAEIINDKISVFVPQDSNIQGLTAGKDGDRRMYISKNHIQNSSIDQIIGTIVHEFDHFKYNVDDSDAREFRQLADEKIGRLIYTLANLRESK